MQVPIEAWDVNPVNGLVIALQIQGERFEVVSSGCELGNWLGFFSQEKLAGFGCTVLDQRIVYSVSDVRCMFEVSLPEGRFRLELRDRLQQGGWSRRYSVTALETSWIGDFVCRSVWPSESWSICATGRRHRGRNGYWQGPYPELSLVGDRLSLRSRLVGVVAPDRFERLGYWRDSPDQAWVLHHRLRVALGAQDQVIWRLRYRARAGPCVPGLTQLFWAFSERVLSKLPGPTPSLQSMGVIRLRAGERLEVRSVIEIATNLSQGSLTSA